MKSFYNFLVSLIPGILFPLGAHLCFKEHYFLGTLIYMLSYASLDFYSYIDKKLNYPNNLFIKHY